MLKFDRGSKYTPPPDVKERAGLRGEAKGGNWDTGVVEHDNEFLISNRSRLNGSEMDLLLQSFGVRDQVERLRWAVPLTQEIGARWCSGGAIELLISTSPPTPLSNKRCPLITVRLLPPLLNLCGPERRRWSQSFLQQMPVKRLE